MIGFRKMMKTDVPTLYDMATIASRYNSLLPCNRFHKNAVVFIPFIIYLTIFKINAGQIHRFLSCLC